MDQWHKVSVFLSVSRHFIPRQLFERSMVIQQTWLVPPQPDNRINQQLLSGVLIFCDVAILNVILRLILNIRSRRVR